MTRVTYNIDPELRWDRKALEWVVLREFRVYWDRTGKALASFIVPADFRTDLASVPKRLRGIVPQVGPNLQAAITHDWCLEHTMYLYGWVEMTEVEKHQLFLDGMASLGVPWLRRKIMYQAVRAWGWWKKLVR